MARGAFVHGALSWIARVVASLTPEARVRFGWALGVVAGGVLRIRRALVEDAMDRAGVSAPRAVADRMYASLGIGVGELLWLSAAPRAELEAAVAGVEIDAEALAELDASLARGPVVLFASHTGNWELSAAAAARVLAARARRLLVVAKAMSDRGIDAFVAKLRERLGVQTVSPRGVLGAALRSLRSGDVLVLPIDQVPERAEHGLSVSFLNETALADRAPATIAWRARATVLVVAGDRNGAGQPRVRILATIPPPDPGSTSRAWIDGTTRAATAALDAFVRQAPAAWMWLHRRWRAPRATARRPPTLVATEEAG